MAKFSKRSGSEKIFMPQIILDPDYQFLQQIEALGPFQTEACFQCRKCTNGCPVAFAMDLYPDEVIRLVLLGQRDTVLGCRTIWVCAACETCTTRCPNEVKIVELMDCLKEMAVHRGVPSPQPRISALHEVFLNNIKRWGRLYETSLVPVYLIKSDKLLDEWKSGTWHYDLKLCRQMFAKGRVPLLPISIRGKNEVRKILAQHKSEYNSPCK